MDNTTERQRRYRERLYKGGFKQIFVWVKRKEGKTPVKMSMVKFVRVLKKLTTGLSHKSSIRFIIFQNAF
jgi:hypothetical protein